MSLQVIINDRTAPLVTRLQQAAQASGLALVGARRVAVKVREHLLDLQGSRHRTGKGSSFYGSAARGVTSANAEGGAIVGIAKRGMRLRLLGGVIRPRPGKRFVAYPAADAPAEAYDRGPTTFPDLELSRQINPVHGGLQWCLIRRASTAVKFTRRKRKDGTISTRTKAGDVRGGEIVFWLARKTTHQADPSVMPSQRTLLGEASEGMRLHLELSARRDT